MISCTEFIPLYSEFFKFLERQGGHDAVVEYWVHISDSSIGDKTNPNSLAYKCEKYGGFGGAIAYWGHTLTEEACDLFEMKDRDAKVRYLHMRHCPSRGMLNALTHVEPYYDYCSHCNVLYSGILENYGIEFVRDHRGVDRAECRSMFYEKGNAPDFDFFNVSDKEVLEYANEGATVVDMRCEDNKYLHRDFHLLGDNALKYCAEVCGKDALVEFLRTFTLGYYAPLIKKISENGLAVLEEWLKKKYETEEATDSLHTVLTDDKLTVTIDNCPAIAFMRTLGKEPSEYYVEETRTVYKTIADASGYSFTLEYYDENGGTRFILAK